jgi:hypothetical protein
MNRSPIIGRFLKDGSTEYRAKGRMVKMVHSGRPGLGWNRPWLIVEGQVEGEAYPTRKAAIERIEQLLTSHRSH